MPQLDKFTYFTQFFWSCLLLFTFYIAICNDGDGVLGISRILKLRNQLVSHRGGGSKRLQRRIDLKRSTSSMGIVERIEYDPNRSSRIAPVRWITEVMQRLVFFMVFPFFWDCLFKGHPFLGSIFGVARNAFIKCFLQMIGTGILGYGSDCWDLSFHVLPGGGGHPDSAEAPLEGVPVEYRPRRESEFEEDFLRVGTKIQLSHPELPLDKVAELATKTVSLENQISQEVQDLLLQKNYPLPTIGAIKEILCQKDGKDLSPQTLQRILKELKFPGVQSKSFQKLLHEMHIG